MLVITETITVIIFGHRHNIRDNISMASDNDQVKVDTFLNGECGHLVNSVQETFFVQCSDDGLHRGRREVGHAAAAGSGALKGRGSVPMGPGRCGKAPLGTCGLRVGYEGQRLFQGQRVKNVDQLVQFLIHHSELEYINSCKCEITYQ